MSIDTEEDNWGLERSWKDISVTNISQLPRLATVFDRLGVRPTYFTSYQVAIDPCAADVLREVGDSTRAEIAAHLHPWNTPPVTEASVPRNSMLKNLPADLQLAKLERLTTTLEEVFEARPTAFRAGRYGLGRETVGALARCGYRVDSSVTPFFNWESFDDGPNFFGAPMVPYRLASNSEVCQPTSDGDLVEIPLSYGFNRAPFTFWARVHRFLETAPLRWFHVAGLAARTGLLSRIVLSPEMATADEMLTLSRRLLEQGVRQLHVSWHSPSLKPGLTPFVATAADVERLYSTVEKYVEGLSRITRFTFATVSEAARA